MRKKLMVTMIKTIGTTCANRLSRYPSIPFTGSPPHQQNGNVLVQLASPLHPAALPIVRV